MLTLFSPLSLFLSDTINNFLTLESLIGESKPSWGTGSGMCLMILWMILLPKRNVYKVPDIIRTSSSLLSPFSFFPHKLCSPQPLFSTPLPPGNAFFLGLSRVFTCSTEPTLICPHTIGTGCSNYICSERFFPPPLKGGKEVACAANEEISFPFRASGSCRELWDITL